MGFRTSINHFCTCSGPEENLESNVAISQSKTYGTPPRFAVFYLLVISFYLILQSFSGASKCDVQTFWDNHFPIWQWKKIKDFDIILIRFLCPVDTCVNCSHLHLVFKTFRPHWMTGHMTYIYHIYTHFKMKLLVLCAISMNVAWIFQLLFIWLPQGGVCPSGDCNLVERMLSL